MKSSTKILVFSIGLGLVSIALVCRSATSLAASRETPGDRRPKTFSAFGGHGHPTLGRVVRYASSGDYRAPLVECEVGGQSVLALPVACAAPQEVELLRVEWPVVPPDGERAFAIVAIATSRTK